MSDILKGLNKEQREAVLECDYPSIILAGAGSGKTRVIVQKVMFLIKEKSVRPNKIVMITFTNKAAKEMKERINKLLGDNVNLGYIGTFHSFCAMILRRSGEYCGVASDFVIYDAEDSSSLLKTILKEIGTKYSPAFFASKISDAKNKLITPERYLDFYSYYKSAEVADVYHKYQKELSKSHAVDFDDLIMKTVFLFQKNKEVLEYYQSKYTNFLVDEFQDTNLAQYILTKLLAGKLGNITVVGDFSQSIYSWRGANMDNLKSFEKDFNNVRTFQLKKNYRSTQKILDFAYDVISVNETHPILELETDQKDGDDIVFHTATNEEEEAVFIAKKIIELSRESDFEDFAVLYRTNAQSRIIEEVFLHYSIAYTLVGGTRFYERKEIKDILSYLRLILNPSDSVSLNRIQKLGKRRFLKFKNFYEKIKTDREQHTTEELISQILVETGYLELYDRENEEDFSRLENIRELSSVAYRFTNLVEFLEQVALVQSEYFTGEKNGERKEGVRLTTLHQAKGLEYENVFIAGLEEGILPHSRAVDDLFQLEEERRLFYVGITRAKKNLYITNVTKRMIFGRRSESVPSRFLGLGNSSGSNDEIVAIDEPDWWT
jgi:DNA helicase-2/ATP-dependent DNA helicase PcrA